MKITREIKRFFTYFSAFNFLTAGGEANLQNQALRVIFLTFTGMALAGIFGQVSLVSQDGIATHSPLFVYLAFCLYIGGGLIYLHNNKPTITTLAPLGYQRRTIYMLLSGFLLSIAIAVAMVLLMMIMGVVMTSILVLIEGGAIFEEESVAEEEVAVFLGYCPMGWVAQICMLIDVWALGIAYAYTRKRRNRILLIAGSFAVLEAVVLLLVNFSTPGNQFVSNGMAFVNFMNLPLPWVWLSAIILLTVGMVGATVYFVVKREKPKAF